MIPALCHRPKVIRPSVVTESQREALRFKLDATCVWFSISTCHRRQAAGLMLFVTPNRWVLLCKPLGMKAAPLVGVNVFCKQGGKRE